MERAGIGVERSMRPSLDRPVRHAFRALNRVVRPLAKRGLGSPFPVGAGLVVLETTGRTSGLRREVPLVGARFGDRVLVSTVRGRSQWIRNVQADPSVHLWLDGRRRSGTATVQGGPLRVATLDVS
jgi:hypothetical protein